MKKAIISQIGVIYAEHMNSWIKYLNDFIINISNVAIFVAIFITIFFFKMEHPFNTILVLVYGTSSN